MTEQVEELKPKARRSAAERKSDLQATGEYVSPIREEETKPGPIEEPPIVIDDEEALKIAEAAIEIFKDDMSPAEQAKARKALARGRPRSLHEKIVVAMAAIDAVEKKGRNEAQKYAYQRATDVTFEVRKEFIKEGLTLVTSIDDVQHAVIGQTKSGAPQVLVTIQGTFTVSDGNESISFTGAGMGVDVADKGLYKAITGMLKYGLRTLLLIPDEKMDPEVEREDERPAPTQKGPITITSSSIPGVQQGGRQTKATDAQINAIRNAVSNLLMDSDAFCALSVSLGVGAPIFNLADDTEAERWRTILSWVGQLSFADAGKITRALVEATQSNGGA